MVKEHARSHLETLTDLAGQLNKASDEYTAELKAIEAKLSSLNLGLEVVLDRPIKESDWELLLVDEEERTTGRFKTRYHFGYGKYQDAWRLVIREYNARADEADELKEGILSDTLVREFPLLEATRELRIAAAAQIPNLLSAIVTEAKETLDTLKKVSDPRKS